MSKKLPHIMIFSGAALIIAACALMIYNKIDDNLAGRRAQQLLDQMMEQMFEEDIIMPDYDDADGSSQLISSQRPPGQMNLSSENHEDETGYNDSDGQAEETAAVKESSSGGGGAAKPKQSPGYNTLGVLQIPAVNLKLPIIDGWTDARGNIAPCSIAGTANPKPKRLIVAGHNLKSHFKSLIDLHVGDEVLFTAKDGTVYRYSVVEVGQCHRDNPEEVSSGYGWDITLVTCKTIRTMRTLIRCAEIPEAVPEEPLQDIPQDIPAEESADEPDGEIEEVG